MKQIYWLFILLFGSYACKDEKSYDYPIIYTGEATQIDTSGVTLSGRLADISSNDIIEYGFVWSSSPNPSIENSEKFVFRNNPQTGVISHRITTTLNSDVEYYFRAFARNKGYTSYGENGSFKSNGCGGAIIQDFYPKTGYWDDTITIIGSGFSSFEGKNVVTINKQACLLINSTQDTLKILPPPSLNQSAPFKITVYNTSALTIDNYTPIIPKISSITPESATFGDIITITLEKYQKSFTDVKVFFNNRISNSITFKDNIITAKVPDDLSVAEAPIRILFNHNLNIIASQTLKLKEVELTDFSPTSVQSGGIITLNGNNFCPIATNNSVTIGGLNATVMDATKNKLQVKVPLQQDGLFDSRNLKINVTVVESSKFYSNTLKLTDRWLRLDDLPMYIGFSSYLKHLTCNNKEYLIISNNGNNLWCYDPQNMTCENKGSLPEEIASIVGSAIFSTENKIYICFSNNTNFENLSSIWEYDTNLEIWSKKQDVQVAQWYYPFTFSYQNKGYIGGGFYHSNPNEIWTYSINDDNWELDGLLPSEISCISHPQSVVINQSAYIGFGTDLCGPRVQPSNKFFKYDLDHKNWTAIPNFPDEANFSGVLFQLNGQLIAGNNSLYSYDPQTNAWSLWDNSLPSQYGTAHGFSLNNKVYLIYIFANESQVWEYDPAL